MQPSAIVFDLEFTAWSGSRERNWTGPGEFREIVQIGAVRLGPPEDFAETGAFARLVQPSRNPVLSRYFTDLTGITQAELESSGIAFAQALEEFAAFVGTETPIYSNGHDALILFENCHLNRQPCPIARNRFHNIGPALADAAAGPATKHVTSSDLSRLLPGVPSLPAHDALSDARMVAAGFRYLAASGQGLPERR